MQWRSAMKTPGSLESVQAVIHDVRAALANDLDTPRALKVLDDWAAHVTDGGPDGEHDDAVEAADVMRTAVNSLLGVRL